MTLSRLLVNGWMDLLSAAVFPLLWLLRDRFDADTAMGLLFWPVVFEMFATVALVLAGMFGSIRITVVRNVWFLLVALGYLGAAWLCGAHAGMPQIAWIALWLLIARLMPPTGLAAGSPAHRAWVTEGAGHSALLWGAGFVVFVLLMLGFSDEPVRNAQGELTSTSPAWIFPVVWAPYFLAEAVLRAWRQPTLPLPR
jgi:hypothetical protein